MSCLVIKDQISHLVHSFAQASLTASSCVNFLLNEQAGAGCRQQEHADWQPQRRSHAFDCFRFLFIFLRPVDLIRKLSKEAFHLMNGQNLSFFHSKLLFLHFHTILFSLLSMDLLWFLLFSPERSLRNRPLRQRQRLEVNWNLSGDGFSSVGSVGWPFGGLTGAMRAASGQSATPGCQSAGMGSIGQLGQGVGVSHLLTWFLITSFEVIGNIIFRGGHCIQRAQSNTQSQQQRKQNLESNTSWRIFAHLIKSICIYILIVPSYHCHPIYKKKKKRPVSFSVAAAHVRLFVPPQDLDKFWQIS